MKSWKLTGMLLAVFGMMLLPVGQEGFAAQDETKGKVAMAKEDFGETGNGQKVSLYTLKNDNEITVQITNYGGIITSIKMPDAQGNVEDIVLGFRSLDKYLEGHPYFGALIGRYGNRIAGGSFSINGTTYSLAQNNGPNSLHGGEEGFDKKVWQAKTIYENGQPALELRYTSPDGEEGYPGKLQSRVIYRLNNDNELEIEYFAETNKPTPVNLTNHTYFNLHGHQGMQSIEDHLFTLNADHFTPVDETLIPTGERRPVEGTPFDFTDPTPIGARIGAENTQIEYGGGYDHNFVLNKEAPGEKSFGGRVVEAQSGRVLEFSTTQPGVQFYTGNFLDGSITGKDGVVYKKRYGFCLETQHYPDSPNQPKFPSTILQPGETYHQVTIYKFTTQ